jgi:predicted nucleotidyltransferase
MRRGCTSQMEPQIERFLEQVSASSPGLGSIWLIGSRANGTATASSDWDFIAFGTEATLQFLRTATHLHREKTDFLVVTNGEDFQVAWGEIDKTGSLSEWNWRERSKTEAEYMQSKWVEREECSRVEVIDRRAVLVWPRLENVV